MAQSTRDGGAANFFESRLVWEGACQGRKTWTIDAFSLRCIRCLLNLGASLASRRWAILARLVAELENGIWLGSLGSSLLYSFSCLLAAWLSMKM